jgi:hypothetical protein
VDFDHRSLADALREAGEEANIDVVVDPRIADKVRTPVSLTLENVLFDTTITLLTETADLDWVWIDKVVFVTSKERAQARKDSAAKVARDKEPRPFPSPPPPPAGSETDAVTVKAEKRPLDALLAEIGTPHGINVVVDQRLGEKAKAAVTADFQAPAGVAVRLLADMADLQVVALEHTMYLTSKENARTLRERVPERK